MSDQASDQVSNQATNQVTDKVTDKVTDRLKSLISDKLGDRAELILFYLSQMPRKSRDILEDLLDVSLQTKNKKRYLDPLLNENWIELTIKENQNDRNQKYQLTDKGRLLVKILKK